MTPTEAATQLATLIAYSAAHPVTPRDEGDPLRVMADESRAEQRQDDARDLVMARRWAWRPEL